jgi:hypothetical protein
VETPLETKDGDGWRKAVQHYAPLSLICSENANDDEGALTNILAL